MNEALLTDKNILTYEYFTDKLLDYKPEEVFVFFNHDNGYCIRRVFFDNLYKNTEEIGDEKIIAIDIDKENIKNKARKYFKDLYKEAGLTHLPETGLEKYIEDMEW
jgi:hypothetical protein